MHTGRMVQQEALQDIPTGRKPKSITIELDLRHKTAELMRIANAKYSGVNK